MRYDLTNPLENGVRRPGPGKCTCGSVDVSRVPVCTLKDTDHETRFGMGRVCLRPLEPNCFLSGKSPVNSHKKTS